MFGSNPAGNVKRQMNMLKKTIYHNVYKDGKYIEEPSDVFLYYEDNKEYVGFHCYFCDKYKDYNNIILVKDLEYSNEDFLKEVFFDNLKKDLIFYIKDFNKKWNKKYSKILNCFDIDDKSKINFYEEEYLIYDT